MENLPKDIQEKIINELSSEDFVRLCSKKNVISENLCADLRVWYRRLKKDFSFLYSEETPDIQKHINYRNHYLEIFTVIQKTIEDVYSEIEEFLGENFVRYLNSNFKKDLTERIKKLILNLLTLLTLNFNQLVPTDMVDISEIKNILPSKYAEDFYYHHYIVDLIIDKVLTLINKLNSLKALPAVPLLPNFPSTQSRKAKNLARFDVNDFMTP